MSEILCQSYSRNYSSIYQNCVRSMPELCHQSARTTSEICQTEQSHIYLYELCQNHARTLPEVRQKSARNMSHNMSHNTLRDPHFTNSKFLQRRPAFQAQPSICLATCSIILLWGHSHVFFTFRPNPTSKFHLCAAIIAYRIAQSSHESPPVAS